MKRKLLHLLIFGFLLSGNLYSQNIVTIAGAVTAEVSEGNPDEDQDDADLKIQSKDGASFRSFIMFDISSLSGDIGSAAIKLYMAQHEDLSSAGLITPARIILIPVENTDWDATLTWNMAEANGMINKDSYSLDYVDVVDYNKPHLSGSDSKWYYLNNSLITSYVNSKVAAGKTKIAFAMVAMDSIPEHDIWVGNWSDKVPTLSVISGTPPVEISPSDVAELFEETPDAVSTEGVSDLKVQKTSAGKDIISLMKFDLSGVSKPISNAEIQVYGAQHEDKAPGFDALDEYMIEVYEANSTIWSSVDLTWNTFNANVGNADIGVALFDMNNRNSNAASNFRSIKSKIISNIRMTELINSYIAAGKTEIAFVFKAGTPNADFDAWVGGTWKPAKLTLEYGEAPISIVATNDGEVNSTMPDKVNPDDNAGDLKFQTKSNGDQIRSYIKFDVSNLKSENIENISMQFYGNQHEVAAIPDRYLLDIYGCADVDKIDNTTLTYTISETFTLTGKTLGRVDVPSGAEATNKVWKYLFANQYALTAYVKEQLDLGKTEVGFALIANEVNDNHDAYVGGATWKAPELKVFEIGALTEVEKELGQQLTPIEDSWVGEASQYVNHDGEADMNIVKATGDNREAYIKFDISKSTSADQIILELKGAQKVDDVWAAIDNFNVNIYGCDDNSWAEAGLLWVNKPAVTTDVLATMNITVTASDWFSFEGTALNDFINGKIAAGDQYITLAVIGADETPGSRTWFSSKDWNAPLLSLYYEVSSTIAKPTFDPVPGLYSGPSQDVTLSTTTEGAKIYYTLDGSVPNEQSTEYTAPISITEAMERVNVQAVAIKDGGRSYLAKGEFVIGTQEPYDGQPFSIPGTITAWKYDLGGQGVAYNELSPDNIGDCGSTKQSISSIRKDGGLMDGCINSDNKGEIGWGDTGEWVEYTVNVSQAGSYTAGLRYLKATDDYPGSVLIQEMDANNNLIKTLVDTISVYRNVDEGDWGADVYQTQVVSLGSDFELSSGLHIIRVTWIDNNWNFAELEIHPAASNNINFSTFSNLEIYPNPASSDINLKFNLTETENINIDIMDATGRLKYIKQSMLVESGFNNINIDLSSLNAGMYFLRIENGSERVFKKFVLVK